MENSNVFSNVSSITDRSPAFGIDLGTTNSCISILKEGRLPEIIPMRDGSKTLPSCVMYRGKNTKAIVGKEAYWNRHKPNVAYSVKRFMGSGKKVNFSYHNENWSMEPAEVSAEILKELVYQISDRYKDVRDVVITVPADFDVLQIEDTIKAGKLAGLNVLSIMREPTAASLVFGLDEKITGNVLVYDLGGGTFDATLLSINSSKTDNDLDALYGFDSDENESEEDTTFVVKATRGDVHLGGDDFDAILLDLVFNKLKSKGIDVKQIPHSYKESLLLRLENLKKSGIYKDYLMNIEYTPKSRSKGKKVVTDVTVTVDDFFEATRIIFGRTKVLIDELLRNYPCKLEGIVTVGGSTKNPVIYELLKKCYEVPVYNDINPDESVSMGAAIHARTLKFKDSGVSVLDVISNGIGVHSDNKVMNIIPRDSMVPCSMSRLFSTVVDNQKEINIIVYSGNSTIPEECVELGMLTLENKEMGPAGSVGVVVKLSVDSNGLLTCYAKVGEEFKQLTLKNILGRQSQTSLSLKERKLVKWKAFVNKMNDSEDKEKLQAMLVAFENGTNNSDEIIEFIRSCRTKRLESFESSDANLSNEVVYENIE